MNDGAELEMDLDEATWIRNHPVYCPIAWCTAHTLRRARCGDADGPYEGLHRGRLRYAKGEARRAAAELARAAAMGCADPGLSVALARLHQEGVDAGMVKGGRPGRRRLFPRKMS